jgi:hypothetical protein
MPVWDLLGRQATLAQHLLVAFETHAAAVTAETTSDHSSSPTLSMPGLAIAVMRSLAGKVL